MYSPSFVVIGFLRRGYLKILAYTLCTGMGCDPDTLNKLKFRRLMDALHINLH